jgi:LuxR family maltose regulon positive regulatory protein
MFDSLLTVKFRIPQLRSELLPREELVRRFRGAVQRPITLVSAPAGFGKSTLLSLWIESLRAGTAPSPNAPLDTVAWLSLDAADNDPLRYWTHFVAAIHAPALRPRSDSASSETEALARILALLGSNVPPALEQVVDALINALAGLPQPLALVLDDYHVIQSPGIRDGMAYLVDHQPPPFRLVIATRSDPPLPLPRLRARGLLSEFRAADLRFSPDEAAGLMRLMLGVDLAPAEADALDRSIEGWGAGLHMAALALQAEVLHPPASGSAHAPQPRRSVGEFIESFSGKHVFVLDYLAEEVFSHQPPDVQAFLLQTSILDRLCAPLCDAVVEPIPTQEAEAPGSTRLGASQAILEYLNRSNLFVIPLDGERRWFRYHHLFADLLRTRLQHTSAHSIVALHRRASTWYEQGQAIAEAVRHAVSAEDFDRAAHLMEVHVQEFLERGDLTTVTGWVAMLPSQVVERRPRLCLQQAWVLVLANRLKALEAMLAQAEAAIEALLRDGPASDLSQAEVGRIRATADFMRSFIAITSGEPGRALDLIRQAQARLPPVYRWELSWLCWGEGYVHRSLGNLDQAAEAFAEALRLSRETGNSWTAMVFLTDLAMIARLRGHLRQADGRYQ